MSRKAPTPPRATRPARRRGLRGLLTRHKSDETTLGIEIDGSRVTGIVLVSGQVTRVLAGQGTSVGDQVKEVLRAAQAGPRVRVAVALSGATCATMTMTTSMASRAEFTAAAHLRTGTHPGTSVVAGLFDLAGVSAGLTAPGLALAAPIGPITDLHHVLDDPRTQIVSPPAVTHPMEGLSLALRDSHAELTLVLASRVAAVCELPAGGLQRVEEALGRGTAIGGRLNAALRARAAEYPRVDPQATDELSRYLQLVATQARSAAQEWILAGHLVPTSVYVHGHGARASQVTPALLDAGFTRERGSQIETPLVLADPDDRAELVTAYLAAQSYDHMAPVCAFVGDRAVRAARAEQADARRARRTRTLGAAAVVLLSATLGPLAVQSAASAVLDRQVQQATQSAARSTGIALQDYATAVTASATIHDPAAVDSALLRGVVDALSPRGKFTSLRTSGATLTLTLATADDPLLALAALEDTPAVHVLTSSTTANPATLTLTLEGDPQ